MTNYLDLFIGHISSVENYMQGCIVKRAHFSKKDFSSEGENFLYDWLLSKRKAKMEKELLPLKVYQYTQSGSALFVFFVEPAFGEQDIP